MRTRPLRLVSFALLLGCSTEPGKEVIAFQPGLVAEPRVLTFSCLQDGCEEELEATITVQGQRSLAIKRVIVADEARTDFTLVTDETAPFILRPEESFRLAVRFRSTGDVSVGDATALVTFVDAAPDEDDPGRAAPGELELPLVLRRWGSARLGVEPSILELGAVPVGSARDVSLLAENQGSGNLGLVIESIETGSPELTVLSAPSAALLPGDRFEVGFRYAPLAAGYLSGEVIFRVRGGADLAVPVRGTSLTNPSLVVEPTAVDFGDTPTRIPASRTVSLENVGGARLDITRIEVASSSTGTRSALSARFADGRSQGEIQSLARADLRIDVSGTEPGPFEASLQLHTNDPMHPVFEIPVSGVLTEPMLEVSPETVDYGVMAPGWVALRTIEITNPGHGELVVDDVAIVGGTSMLFTVVRPFELPLRLAHGERAGFDVEFRAEAPGLFRGAVVIRSGSTNSSHEVALQADSSTCEAACSIPNATPDCTMGDCRVADCTSPWIDVDEDQTNGCECSEVVPEPGSFCADGRYLGVLNDEAHDSMDVTGLLPTEDDEDVYMFFGSDTGSNPFSDSYRVRVSLESDDPGVSFCVYRHGAGSHGTECYFEEEDCPTDRSFERGGSTLNGDSADYIVRVSRAAGTAPSCTTYTLHLSNG